MRDEADLLQKAAQCMRLAGAIPNRNDAAIGQLLKMAEELEARFAGLERRRKFSTD